VLLLPRGFEHCGGPHDDADPYHLRGDFLVHCHVEMHMMAGLVALVRSHQTVYLYRAPARRCAWSRAGEPGRLPDRVVHPGPPRRTGCRTRSRPHGG
jgi:hypothetical protein